MVSHLPCETNIEELSQAIKDVVTACAYRLAVMIELGEGASGREFGIFVEYRGLEVPHWR